MQELQAEIRTQVMKDLNGIRQYQNGTNEILNKLS